MSHILVIGAGIVGLSVARAALRRGHRVTLIEQGEVPNPRAASSDQHRMIRFHYGAAEGYTRMVALAFEAWRDLWRELGVEHYAPSGALAVSLRPGDYADETAKTFGRLQIAHEMLDAGALARLCPHLDLPFHARGVLAAGGPLFADRIMGDLARSVRDRGAEILEQTRAVAVDPSAGSLRLADGRVLGGDLVVVAAGAWLPDLLPADYGALPVWRQTLCYVDAPPAYRESWAAGPALVVLGDQGVYTLPPRAGTGLKFGSGEQRRPGRPSDGLEAALDFGWRVIEDFGPYLRDAAAYRPFRLQAGYYVMDESRRFRLEHMGRRIVVTNCDGQMFKFGPLIGERILSAWDGETSFADLARWAAGN